MLKVKLEEDMSGTTVSNFGANKVVSRLKYTGFSSKCPNCANGTYQAEGRLRCR